jgi:hypothetical protein
MPQQLRQRERISLREMSALSPVARELRTSAAAIPVVDFVPFLLWLNKQRDRDDVTGRFAKFVDRLETLRGGHFSGVVALMCQTHAVGGPVAVTMLDLSLCEWRRQCLVQRAMTAKTPTPGRP